jgi:hypothetical protein
MIDGMNVLSVLTAWKGVTDVPNKGFKRFLLMEDDFLYIFTYQDTVNRLTQRKVKIL